MRGRSLSSWAQLCNTEVGTNWNRNETVHRRATCLVVFLYLQDKTFGLKNKKGKKQQQFIKNVTQQVKYGGQSLQKVISRVQQVWTCLDDVNYVSTERSRGIPSKGGLHRRL